jgi:phage terminase small subunit
MAELKNPKHEKFVQHIVRGLSPTEAYISAGYSRKGAHASAARLLKNPQVCTRLAELRKAVEPILEEAIVKLIVTERFQRLDAIQDRWDALREAKACFAREDYEAAMKTGVVCRKRRMIGSGNNAKEIVEYEINMALIEALNSVEKGQLAWWTRSSKKWAILLCNSGQSISMLRAFEESQSIAWIDIPRCPGVTARECHRLMDRLLPLPRNRRQGPLHPRPAQDLGRYARGRQFAVGAAVASAAGAARWELDG